MLTKIIDLGFEVPESGEPRARLLQPALVKTASTEIQQFWDSMQPDENSSFLWVIGVSAKEFYGCNNNGDAFTEEDLKATHASFVDNAHVFLQHVNRDPAKSIGKPVYSWYNEPMHRIELILRIDKTNPASADIVRRIRESEPVYVSMGCTVDYDVCSICGNQAKTRRDYCDHLRFNMRKILPDGRQVYALNPKPRFFDISIVRKPADPTAFTLDKRASEKCASFDSIAVPTSAELGEQLDASLSSARALKKFANIIKRVEGQAVEASDSGEAKSPESDSVSDLLLSSLKDGGFSQMEYPEMPYSALENMGVSPRGLLGGLTSLGCPLSFGDAAWMSGRACYGRTPEPSEFSEIFSLLPSAISRLIQASNLVDRFASSVCAPYAGELEEPVHRTLIIRVIRPVAEARISIIHGLGSPSELIKIGQAFGQEPEAPQFGATYRERFLNDFRSRKENFAPITLRDRYGNEAVTTPYALRQSMVMDYLPNRTFAKPAVAAALALGSLGAVMLQPGLLRKLLALAASGLPLSVAYNLLKSNSKDGDLIATSEGYSIPRPIVESAWKIEKKASLTTPRLGTLAGMALPGALALDYAYNRWKYGPYENPNGDDLLTSAGAFASEHPLATTLAGGVIGSQVSRLPAIGRMLLRRGK